jgi:hypothetical protein
MARETSVLKKFVKAARFGLNHVNEEFTSGEFPNKLTVYCRAACGGAATNVFHLTCLSFCPGFMQLESK